MVGRPAVASEPPTTRGKAASARAVGLAAALFTFFLVIKICLLLWNLLVAEKNPLADVPRPDGVLYLPGADLLLCFGAAMGFYLTYRVGGVTGRVVRWGAVAIAVVFSVSSFQVSRIYGAPLDIELLRSADDLMVFRRSMWAYVGPMPVALLAYGLVGVPPLGVWLGRRLDQRRRLRPDSRLWAWTAIVCVGMGALQWIRLHRVNTFGVKENAIVFFVKHYKPPFKAIDSKQAMAELQGRLGADLRRDQVPGSVSSPGRQVSRDFPFDRVAQSGRGLNLIVIQMESTGAPHVDRTTTPNIAALADHALSFKRHFTAVTQTRPASYALYYSDYLPDLGTNPRLVYGRPMPQPMLAEVLHRVGYRTGVFHTGFLDYLEIRYLFADKGVETLVGAREMTEAGAPLAYSSGVHEERTVDELAGWIRRHKAEKFCAFYLTEFPHHPYISMSANDPFPDDTWLNRYRNSLHYADKAVGRLVEMLKAEGLIERTLIVVVGDHGETVSHYPVGHGLRVTAEEVRTPLILSNPVVFPAAVESRVNSHHLDVAPTIVSLLGLDTPREWLGRDLLADRAADRLHFITITQIRRIGVVDGDSLYVLERESGKGHQYTIGEGELTALSQVDAAATGLTDRYRREAEWFIGWSVWRHLDRAQNGAGKSDEATSRSTITRTPTTSGAH